MKPSTLVASLATLATTAAAQFTSPAGLDSIEGNSSSTVLFGAIDRRFQQIDATSIGGGPRTITGIQFRRDGGRTAPSATSRNIDVTIVMGHANVNAITATFANNYVGPPSLVLATTQVNIPDWTAAVAGPAVADFAMLLDTPFMYNGTDALVLEIVAENSDTLTHLYVDRQLGDTPYNHAPGVVTGIGCTVGGQTQPFEASVDGFNWGNNHPLLGQRLVLSASYAVPNAPVAIDVCLNTPALPVPGLCAPFLPDLIVGLSLGVTSPGGFTGDLTIDVEYNPALDGIPIAVQALCLDVSQGALPVALSGIEISSIPAPNMPLECHYVYAGPSESAGLLLRNRGMIITLQ